MVMDNQVSIAWRLVAFVTIAKATANAVPLHYNTTGIYKCQGKAYDFDSHGSLIQMLKVTNATVGERINVWGCEHASVQGGFHESYQEP